MYMYMYLHFIKIILFWLYNTCNLFNAYSKFINTCIQNSHWFKGHCNVIKDWSTLFSFALGNERTLVTCKSCEVRSASQRFTLDQCPFISQMQTNKSVLQSLYLCWSDEKPLKTWKNQCQFFPSHDQCLSSEDICHSFLMLNCTWMTWECKYLIPIICKHLNFYIRGVARMVMDFVQIMHNWCTLCKNQKMTKSWLLWPPVAMATTILFSLTENTGF